MGLTPEMIRWNERVEEIIKGKNKPKRVVEGDANEIYNLVEERLLKMDPDFKVIKTQKYIAFKINKNIVDIEILQRSIKCHINLKKGELKDPKRLTRDVSGVGHFGSGDYELILANPEEIDYLFGLIQQSYNKHQGL